MLRGVYSAGTAMATAQQWLDVIAHNLANSSTTAFKRDGIAFNDGLVRELAESGGRGRKVGSLGAGSVLQGKYTDRSVGPIHRTGNRLDVAILDEAGAFAVRTPAGIRHTRDGSFTLDHQRRLIDQRGNPVLDQNLQPIVVPPGQPEFDAQGRLHVDGELVAQIGVWDGEFTKVGHSLHTVARPRLLPSPRIEPMALEGSNVNAVSEMVSMIRLNRAFELAQRHVQSQDESLERLIQSLRNT
jgi:flagellar basal body rod protein FlgG